MLFFIKISHQILCVLIVLFAAVIDRNSYNESGAANAEATIYNDCSVMQPRLNFFLNGNV